jgi:Lipocalin-like domain
MRRVIWIAAALGLGLGLGFPAPTENVADAKRFVGSWKLISIESANPDATRGAHPVGLIYYDAAGNMAVQIMPDRKRAAWKPGESPTPEQAKDAIAGYTAYFGTYTVDEQAHTVSHHRQGTINAGAVGVDLVRRYELAPGDRLILTPVESPTLRLTWERVK